MQTFGVLFDYKMVTIKIQKDYKKKTALLLFVFHSHWRYALCGKEFKKL